MVRYAVVLVHPAASASKITEESSRDSPLPPKSGLAYTAPGVEGVSSVIIQANHQAMIDHFDKK